MEIFIASNNPVKVASVQSAFERVYSDLQLTFAHGSVPSKVPDQPLSDNQTRRGAINRAKAAQRLYPKADFWIGLEGGLDSRWGATYSFAWISILHSRHLSTTRTATFALPPDVVSLIRSGHELGSAMDKLHHRHNSKQQEGAIGILSHNHLSRKSLYTDAVITALIPFINYKRYRLPALRLSQT